MLQLDVRRNAIYWSPGSILLVGSALGCGDTRDPAVSCAIVSASVREGSGAITYSGIASGRNGTCVVASNGRVLCWEHGDQGEAVEVADVLDARRVVVGPERFCAIRDGGNVVCWTDLGAPEEVPSLCGATELAAGHLLTCAVASGGEVLCQGASEAPEDVVRIPGVAGATALALGPNGYTCALIDGGGVTCWGGGPGLGDRPEPAAVSEISGALSIAGSEGFDVCAVLTDHTVSCWNPSKAPAPVEGLSQVASLAVGQGHGCASLADGSVRCWGTNRYGELGDGTQTDSDVAVPVVQLDGVREVSVGTRVSFDMGFSCALRTDDSVACWGAKTQVAANGDWIASPTPVGMRLP